MAGFTAVATGIGLATTAVTTGMSFAQAAKQRDIQLKAEAEASKYIEEARQKLSVNYLKGLSIQKEPYELEREALNISGAQAMEAAKDSDMRGVAATAGRVQMAQTAGQRGIANAQVTEMEAMEKATAVEEGVLRDQRVGLDLKEASGAQVAAGRAANLSSQATAQGMEGVMSMGSQIAALPALYGKTKGARQTGRLSQNAADMGWTPEQYRAKVSELGKTQIPELVGVSPDMDENAFNDYMMKLDPKILKNLNDLLFYEDVK